MGKALFYSSSVFSHSFLKVTVAVNYQDISNKDQFGNNYKENGEKMFVAAVFEHSIS